MRRIVLLALATTTLQAQFSDFAVTGDGRLFFTTPLTTGDEDMRGKVFLVTGDGISLFATGSDKFDPAGPDAILPLTSGDGSVHGYATRYRDCNPRCSAFVLPRTSFTLNGVEGFSGSLYDLLQVSRNARFLLGQTYDAKIRLTELPSLQTREFPQYFLGVGPQGIANTGAILMRDVRLDAGPLLYTPLREDPRPIPGTAGVNSAILSPRGDLIAYERANKGFWELVLTDPQGSTHRVLAPSQTRGSFQPSFANDGTLLYLDVNRQPMLLAPGAEPRILLTVEGGMNSAILSGNGEIAWFTTSNGRLLRVRTADASVDEFIPETPQIDPVPLSALPGSVIRIFGTGLSERTQLTLAGTTLQLTELSGQRAAAQLPWEFATETGERRLTIQAPGNSFHQLLSFYPLNEPAVTFERGSTVRDLTLQAAHQDFRGVISGGDPARPGETIHVFARNLGPVDQPIASGQRSPTSPPARIVTPLTCTLQEAGASNPTPRVDTLAIPFAGLSSGSIGIYQIDITIPASWSSPSACLQCKIGSRGDIDRIAIAAPAGAVP